MIIVCLRGGLGNQLFQYALGRTLALRNGTELKLDTSRYQGKSALRKLGLEHFNIKATIATKVELNALTKEDWPPIIRRLYGLIQLCLPYSYKDTIYEKRNHRFDPEIHRHRRSKYLIGFWQSERYFQEIDSILRRELTPRARLSVQSDEVAQSMGQVDSVSIHVRRNDYVTNPHTYEIFRTCSLDYYHSAMERIVADLPNPHFFIFSDDMDWTCQNLRLNYPMTFVRHNRGDRDYEDLLLMSQCKHHIIANSTFSWWGAWLGRNQNKMVVAPKQWVRTRASDCADLVPDSWIKL